MARLLLWSIVVVCGVGTAGWFLTRGWGPDWNPSVMFVSAGVNLTACWVSFVPISIVSRKRRDYLPQAALAGITIRMFIAGSATLASMMYAGWNVWALGFWMISFYLALLVVDVLVTLKVARQCDSSNDTTAQ